MKEPKNHSVLTCRCDDCLQWWLEAGPHDTGYGWSFGLFTEEEYKAAGGIVPDYEEYRREQEFFDEIEEDLDGPWVDLDDEFGDDLDEDDWGDDEGDLWDFSESMTIW